MYLIPTIYVHGSTVVSMHNLVLDILTEKARRTGENVLTTKRDQDAHTRAVPVPAVPALAHLSIGDVEGGGDPGDPAAFLAM